jgi:hypothetical protein
MGKVITCKKDFLHMLYDKWKLLPTPQIGGENEKYVKILRALRKPIKDEIKRHEKIMNDWNKKRTKFHNENIDPLVAKKAEDKTKASEYDVLIKGKEAELRQLARAVDDEVDEMNAVLKEEDTKVVFDANDLSYFEEKVRKNGHEIFTQQQIIGTGENPVINKFTDGEMLMKVLDFIESAVNDG